MQIFENSDEKQYNQISIRKFVLNNFKKNVVSKLIIKKRISSLKKFRLFTFNNTSLFKFKLKWMINIFMIIEISKWNVSIKNKKMIFFFEKTNH